jgi:hypothetical protein
MESGHYESCTIALVIFAALLICLAILVFIG